MSLEDIRLRGRTLHRKVRRRNLSEYVATVLVVLTFGFYIFRFPGPVTRLGSGLVIAGVLYMAWQLHRRGSAGRLPEECGFESCLDFHRKELERQRDALRSVWSWYLGPLIPGLAVFILGGLFAKNPRGGHIHVWIGSLISLVVCSLVFFFIGRLNQIAARSLQRQIDELDAAAGRG